MPLATKTPNSSPKFLLVVHDDAPSCFSLVLGLHTRHLALTTWVPTSSHEKAATGSVSLHLQSTIGSVGLSPLSGDRGLGPVHGFQACHELAALPCLCTRLSFPVCNVEMALSVQPTSSYFLWNSK